MHSRWEKSYDELWQWRQVQEHYVPGFVTKPIYYYDHLVPRKRVFHHFLCTFKQCITAFWYYKPLVQIDCTYLYGRYKHKSLIVVTQDGNRRILPIAFAITPKEFRDD
ncbi:hypothetical protein PVK06_039446 [Gossypium arboreum]|uniref:Uncharacterized protein n=1 Tax=Gossypium arboreum TaxID=29729 RepID=A0ABR0N500_GOSAR|nr:hypothetical protein PVK06_039446 [Gossypium arboreum]